MRTKRFLSVVFISVFMCLCFLFTACSSNPSGVYMVEKVQVKDGNNSLTIGVGDTYEGTEVTEDMLTLKIMDDGTVIVRVRSYYEKNGKLELDEEYLASGVLYEGMLKGEYYVKLEDEEQWGVIKKQGKKLTLDVGEEIVYTLTK